MPDTIQVGEQSIAVTRKDVKNVHLSVHPPNGRVTLVAPTGTRLEVARAYAISKLGWIRQRQSELRGQARETPRRFVERESHYLWGRRYLLTVIERDGKPSVALDHRRIRLFVRPGTGQVRRAAVIHEWHKNLLHEAVPPLIRKWEQKLNVDGTCLAPGGVKKAGVSGETCERTANIAPPASADQPKSGVSEP